MQSFWPQIAQTLDQVLALDFVDAESLGLALGVEMLKKENDKATWLYHAVGALPEPFKSVSIIENKGDGRRQIILTLKEGANGSGLQVDEKYGKPKSQSQAREAFGPLTPGVVTQTYDVRQGTLSFTFPDADRATLKAIGIDSRATRR